MDDFPKIKTVLNKLRMLLIFLTIIELAYLVVIFTDDKLWLELDKFKANWIVWIFHYFVIGVFIWFIWKKMPSKKKNKVNNTFMILFLGLIGMWLWIPSEKELNKYNND